MNIVLPSGTPAYLVTAEAATTSVVITPDIFGLRPLFADLADRLAREWSVNVIVVEPFPGRDLGDAVEPRFAAVPELDDDAHLSDLVAAADRAGGDHTGLLGFCMGGMYCFKAARAARLERIVSFYGMIRLPPAWAGPGQREPLDYLEGADADKVLAIIGEHDPYTPPADVLALEATGVHVVRYRDAEHGFAHAPERPTYRHDDAVDAFERARQWLCAPR